MKSGQRMFAFRPYGNEVEPVTFLRVTDRRHYLIRCKHRETIWEAQFIFPTFEEARAELLRRRRNAVKDAREVLARAEKELAKAEEQKWGVVTCL